MDIMEIRHKNLNRLLERYDSQRAFADATDLPATFVSQLVTKRRSVGERVARKIEIALSLEPGWMDSSLAKIEPSGNIDVAQFKKAIIMVETILNEHNMALPPAKKADLIALFYDELRATGRNPDKAKVVRLARLAA